MRREVICGIYKITSPTGRVYVGKSVDIYSRWSDYRKPYCVKSGGQPFISRSLIKYGCDNHKFEIIEVCDKEKLKRSEKMKRAWDTMRKNGYKRSEETKKRISETRKQMFANKKLLQCSKHD